MTITVPAFGDEIRAEEFGTPVAEAINSISSLRNFLVAGWTAPASALGVVVTNTFNVAANPAIAGLMGICNFNYTTTVAASILNDATVVGWLPPATGGTVTIPMFFPRVANTVPMVIRVQTGAATVVFTTSTTFVMLAPVLTLVTGNVWP